MQVIFKYRKHLLYIGIIAVISAIVFSSPFFIKPLYKSSVILYPTASNSISKALLSENSGNTKDILEFGEDDAYVQQQLPIVEDLLRQAAEKEKSENVSVSSASQQQAKRVAEQLAGVEDESRRNAIMEQAELNQRGLDEDGDKKKW